MNRNRQLTTLVAGLSPLLLLAPSSTVTKANVAAAVTSTSYYLSCSGNDANSGTSPRQAWASLRRASSERYGPGDQIRLQRGCIWNGTLQPRGAGTPSQPILISAYGSGALPRLIGEGKSALTLANVSGWTAENLDLSQINQTPQALDAHNELGRDSDQDSDLHMSPVVEVRARGPSGQRSCGASCTDSYITLRDLVVHDGQWNGIFVEAGDSDPAGNQFGYVDHLLIEDVESRSNQSAGISIGGTLTKDISYELRNVRVLDDYVHDNGGDGLAMGQVKDGLIQGNRCSYNGRIRNARVGCWAWDSKWVTIQYNESDHKMTPLTDSRATDGGGFDLDMGSIDSTMQYNWSHDNEGEGYLLESWPLGYGYNCCITTNVTVRYNVSERDGQEKAEGISVLGGVNPAWVYNNTVYHVVSSYRGQANRLSGTGGDLTTSSYPGAGSPVLSVFNNLFVTDGRAQPSAVDTNLWSDGEGTFYFDDNLWERLEGGVAFQWGQHDINTWSAWQGTGFDPHGGNADPDFTGPVGSGPSGYQLRTGSPAIGAGMAPSARAGKATTTDYFGESVPQGSRYDLGAAAYTGTYSRLDSHATPAVPMTFGPSEHLASITPPGGDGLVPAVLNRGSRVSWAIKIVDGSGSPVAGTDVRVIVYAPAWTSIAATLTARTNSDGMAEFSQHTRVSDAPGTYFVFVSQVLPESGQMYYDSSQNTVWATGFALR